MTLHITKTNNIIFATALHKKLSMYDIILQVLKYITPFSIVSMSRVMRAFNHTVPIDIQNLYQGPHMVII